MGHSYHRETAELNDNTEQMDPADVYTASCPHTVEYMFSLADHGTVSQIDHILGNKENVNKHRKIEISPCSLSNCNDMKTKNQQQGKRQKIPKVIKTEKHTVKNKWIIVEIKREI